MGGDAVGTLQQFLKSGLPGLRQPLYGRTALLVLSEEFPTLLGIVGSQPLRHKSRHNLVCQCTDISPI